MIRKDREMDREFAEKVIDRADFGTLSIYDENSKTPYSVPLSVARRGSELYFHSAKVGQKVGIIKNGDLVSMSFVSHVKVPEIFSIDEIRKMIDEKLPMGDKVGKIFTTEFESAIITGKITRLEDDNERVEAMKAICEKYTPSLLEFFPMAMKISDKATALYKIEIKEITGKRKKFDKAGKELKFGREE